MRPPLKYAWEALAVLAGLLFTLAFAPFNYSFFAIIGLSLLFASWQHCSPKRALLRGYLFGLAAFGLGVSWVFVSIHDFGKASVWSAGLLSSLFCGFWAIFPALAGYVSACLSPSPQKPLSLLAMPVVWLWVEYLRGYWALDGFPWLQISYSQLDAPLAGFIPLLGAYGTGFIGALTATGLLWLVQGKRYRGSVATGLLLLWLGGGFLQTITWTHALGLPIRVSLIQGNISQDKKWRPEFKMDTLNFYKTMTESHWSSAVVVWPETSIPAYLDTVNDWFIEPLNLAAKAKNTDLIVSLPVRTETERFNAVMTLGKSTGFYKKKHLLPFGEFLPWQPFSGWVLSHLGMRLGDFTPGSPEQTLLKAGGYPFITSICYEDVFGAAGLVGLPEAAYLVNVTNDGWFGDSIEPHQHLQMARMRALETGRYLLRSANTGITALIGPDGQIISQLPLFTATVLTGSITPMGGMTPYARWGDAPALSSLLILAAWLAYQKLTRTKPL